MPQERELTEPVDLARGRQLNPDAVGWSRTPLHRTEIDGWGRTKRWEYWGIVTDTHVIGLTVAGLDYLSTASIYVLDRTTKREWRRDGISPFARPRLSDVPGDGTAALSAGGVDIEITDAPGATAIRAEAKGVRLAVEVERDGTDSLSVVVPWSERHFQMTTKDLANRVAGTLTLDDEEHEVRGWAVLDRGRGRWPYRNTWNWGAGSGVVHGERVAVQVGGRWTDGTGSTENAIFVAGRLHKISEDLEWVYDRDEWESPWHVLGERIALTFRPFHVRHAMTEAGVIAVKTHQAFGRWNGMVILEDGTPQRVDDVVGWAEECRNRW